MSLPIGPAWHTAWEGTAQRLFRPFNGRKWLWLAFSAWLATMLEGGGSGGQYNFPGGGDRGNVSPEMERAGRWVLEHLGCVLAVAVPLVLLALVVIVALSYLKARAEFVFLDQVLGDHIRFEPGWYAFRREGKSVFLWRWGLVGVALLSILVLVGLGVLIWATFGGPRGAGLAMRIALTVPLVLLFLTVCIGAALADFYLKQFVIPIMAKHHLLATEAWRRFLPRLRADAGSFALYTLMVLAIWIAVAMAIVFAGCLTCCIGFIILALPWIGTLPLLPVLVFFRLLSVAFLAELGPEYDLLGASAAPSSV